MKRKRLTEAQVVERLRERVKLAGSAVKLAKAIPLTQEQISNILRGHSRPGRKTLAALGLRAVVHYEEIEPCDS